MAYCRNCGKKIEDEANFCSFCGTKIYVPKEKVEVQEKSSKEDVSLSSFDKQEELDTNDNTRLYSEKTIEQEDKGITLGIIGIVFCFLPFVTWICSAIGLDRAKNSKNITGKILNIIALSIAGIFRFYFLLFTLGWEYL